MTARQWRLMPARRADHGKKEANVCWLGEHAVSHHKLAVQFPTSKWTYRHCCFARADKTSLPMHSAVSFGQGKNAEELMTNVAKNFATGSIGRSDLFSTRNDLIEAGGWTKGAVEKRPLKLPMTLLTRLRKKVRPARR